MANNDWIQLVRKNDHWVFFYVFKANTHYFCVFFVLYFLSSFFLPSLPSLSFLPSFFPSFLPEEVGGMDSALYPSSIASGSLPALLLPSSAPCPWAQHHLYLVCGPFPKACSDPQPPNPPQSQEGEAEDGCGKYTGREAFKFRKPL